MPVSMSFPIPFPNLTRVNELEGAATAVEDLNTYISQHLPLIILGDFQDTDNLIDNANRLCTQPGALPTQRVLWLRDETTLRAVLPQLDAAIKLGFPGKAYQLDNIRALSIDPKSGRAAYLIFKNPQLSPDPNDSKKSLSTFQMQRAFNAAIAQVTSTSGA